MSDNKTNDELIRRWTKAITVKVHEGNRVRYLIDGQETFQAMYDAIATVFSSEGSSGYYIYLLGWWLDDNLPLTGKPGSSILELFRAASLVHKVQIRVILWDQAINVPNLFQKLLPWPWNNTDALQKNTEEIKRVNELPTGAGILDNNTLYVVGDHHQKVLIVKGRLGLIGFCGGVDINVDRIQTIKGQPHTPLHDVHCQIEGDAAHSLVDVFVQRWLAPPREGGKGPLLGLADRVPPSSKPKLVGSQFVGIARTFNFVSRYKNCVKEHSIQSTMIAAIKTAKKFIYIEDQYLVNFIAADELRQALSHIQHLTIVIPHTSLPLGLPRAWWARARFIDILKESSEFDKKVRIFYRVTPGTTRLGPHSYVHAKTWIFDDELAVIGSANCNRRGWESGGEVIAAIFDKAPDLKSGKFSFAQKLRMKLWAEHLGIKEDLLKDGVLDAHRWLDASSTAAVRRYNPIEAKDSSFEDLLSWDRAIDPGTDYSPRFYEDPTGNLSLCGEASTIAR